MSSSLEAQQLPTPTRKKALDFFKLYPTDQETSKVLEKSKKGRISDAENVSNKLNKPETPKPGKLGGKKNKKDSLNLSNMNTTLNISRDARLTSTPYGKDAKLSVKPIIKHSATLNESNEESISMDHSEIISKKRHKSVSFQLDEADETATKKSKSNAEPSEKSLKKGKYKIKKQRKVEKESNEAMETADPSDDKLEMDTHEKENKPTSKKSKQVKVNMENTILNDSIEQSKKKFKKNKQIKMENAQIENDNNNNDNNEKVKNKKTKKNKKAPKQSNENAKEEGKNTTAEPQGKNTKKNIKPEVIAEDLENLSIADNDKADIITDMLDDMTVVDKSAKKKSKGKAKLGKNKKDKINNEEVIKEGEEVKEKEKVAWKKRRWNKDKKAVVGISLQTSVIVENLPAKILQEYRKLLTEHFTKCGTVKSIGVAETHPEDKSVFSTTVNFSTEEAATLALQETDTYLHDSVIRVKRPLPPTKTTLVARSYGALTEAALTQLFQEAGRIRGMRFLIKGKKAMSTAFIEFEGPRAVERAIEIAKEAKIGGKNMHVSRFEQRQSHKPDAGAKETDSKEPMST
ncbi:MATH and LRR domain-containing protein PFE0570w [Plutella xylostella]|uniref:MATH and LRR domain-containing protein PFE0570w n=1 Tax=Plutella xylostella TaxID=51655 RepID=UPI0020324013|nr:MATH and LRR domain-containing protein PFE0570w [Plutella xylostella]